MIDKLKRWISGDTDWKAEQNLDKISKDDAFLADALEGYRSFTESDHEENIRLLKSKLKDKKRSGILIWTRIAAAAIIIALIAVPLTLRFNPDEEIAIAEPAQSTDSEAENNALSGSTFDENLTDTIVSTKDIIKNELRYVEVEPVDKQNAPPKSPPRIDPANIEAGIMEESDLEETELAESTIVESKIEETADTNEAFATASVPAVAKDNTLEADDESQSQIAKVQAESVPPVVAKKNKESPKTRTKRKRDAVSRTSTYYGNKKTIRGKIVAEFGEEELIGASIYIKDTNEGASSDFDGRFSLSSAAELPWIIVIEYVGYQTKEIMIPELDDYRPLEMLIVMEEAGATLSEVVVTSAKEYRSKAKKQKNTQPKTNFRKLRRHIRKQMNYPEAAIQNNIEGVVRLRFFIAQDGTPVNFTLMESLGYGCDEEAIRLLSKGPKWKPVNRYTEYSVEFKR